MSTNLGRTDCAFCGSDVVAEPPRPIRPEECGVWFPQYSGSLVGKAVCVDCNAPYLAYYDLRPYYRFHKRYGAGVPHLEEQWLRHDYDGTTLLVNDLSYYHTFNDEPAPEDYPDFEIVRRVPGSRRKHRPAATLKRPWPRCLCGRKATLESWSSRNIVPELERLKKRFLIPLCTCADHGCPFYKGAAAWCGEHDDCRLQPEMGRVCLTTRFPGVLGKFRDTTPWPHEREAVRLAASTASLGREPNAESR